MLIYVKCEIKVEIKFEIKFEVQYWKNFIIKIIHVNHNVKIKVFIEI